MAAVRCPFEGPAGVRLLRAGVDEQRLGVGARKHGLDLFGGCLLDVDGIEDERVVGASLLGRFGLGDVLKGDHAQRAARDEDAGAGDEATTRQFHV